MDTEFQMDNTGRFRIRVGSSWSKWVSYRGIASIQEGSLHFIGVSEYYGGVIPTEKVLLVKVADED